MQEDAAWHFPVVIFFTEPSARQARPRPLGGDADPFGHLKRAIVMDVEVGGAAHAPRAVALRLMADDHLATRNPWFLVGRRRNGQAGRQNDPPVKVAHADLLPP